MVVNHGHGYWYSSQEVVHFLALLHLEAVPQIAVFLDGFNDFFISSKGYAPTFYAPVLWDAWEAERRRRQYPAPGGAWFQFTQSFPTVRLHRLLQPLSSSRPRGPNRFEAQPEKPVQRVLEVYRTNRRIAAAIAEAFGIQAHFFLQPISTVQQSKNQVLRRIYRDLITEAEAQSSPDFFSLHDVLDGMEKAYIDTIHYNERASQVLAERMAKRIVDTRIAARSDR